ncbi:HAD-IB family hydrolase [Clostridium sp. BJN0001]|uniref:HAD-IB family hydrolase n=1 Tax=Clostridium sp. BJN0001 TaxID=2930219 RepID=UPI001FD43F4B|nr:HAD-IB family hydrolase [Clostridium sp. BJN0001]
MANVAAFFDLDGTLYREGLITEMFKKMVKYEIIPPERWYNEVRPYYIQWDRRQGDYDSYLLKMVEIYVDTIKGFQKSNLSYIAEKVVEQKGDRVYTYTRDRIRWHKNKNHKLIIISGSPSSLVEQMAEKYGFTDYIGSKYVYDKKTMRFTGEVIPMWDGKSKSEAIKKLVDRYDISLKDSFAYGDTSGDFEMFKSVGYPSCINPTKELLNMIVEDKALKDKINVIVERKDVIYNIDIENIQFK